MKILFIGLVMIISIPSFADMSPSEKYDELMNNQVICKLTMHEAEPKKDAWYGTSSDWSAPSASENDPENTIVFVVGNNEENLVSELKKKIDINIEHFQIDCSDVDFRVIKND